MTVPLPHHEADAEAGPDADHDADTSHPAAVPCGGTRQVQASVTTDAETLAAAAALRRRVFVGEQGVAPDIEADGRDGEAVHVVVLGGSDGRQVVATGRMLAEDGVARLGRICTDPASRGQGAGAAVVAALVAEAARRGLSRARLHAQAPVVSFYREIGWAPLGRPDVEAGLDHQWMGRHLLTGLRPARDDDGPGLERLIGDCWSEYPGCVLDVDAEEPWLRAPASAYRRGGLWVMDASVGGSPGGPGGAGALAACVAVRPGADPRRVELKSLYVARVARGGGLGAALVARAEQWARSVGAQEVELWSDTRFDDAHRLYERLGYRRMPETRDLHDLSNTTEYHFLREL